MRASIRACQRGPGICASPAPDPSAWALSPARTRRRSATRRHSAASSALSSPAAIASMIVARSMSSCTEPRLGSTGGSGGAERPDVRSFGGWGLAGSAIATAA